MAQQHARVYREIIHALLGLFNQRVAENLPVQFLGLAADFLKRLVNRHRADGHRRVAQYPLARLVDVLAGREIHHRVGAPARRPHHLLDFLGDRRGHRRIADVGVDLDQKIAANGHRLGFGVVDVGRDDGAPARDLVADELRRHLARHGGVEIAPGVLAQQFRVGRVVAQLAQAQVLADGDIFHLRRHDAAPGVVHLRYIATGARAPRRAPRLKTNGVNAAVGGAVAGEIRTGALQRLAVAAPGNPAVAHRRKPAQQIRFRVFGGIRPGGVVHRNRRVAFAAETRRRVILRYLAHADAHIGARPGHIHLAQAALAGRQLPDYLLNLLCCGTHLAPEPGDSIMPYFHCAAIITAHAGPAATRP